MRFIIFEGARVLLTKGLYLIMDNYFLITAFVMCIKIY